MTALIVFLLVAGAALLVAEAHVASYGVLGSVGLAALAGGLVLALGAAGAGLALSLALAVPVVVGVAAFGVRFLRDAVRDGHGDAVRRAVAELEPSIDDLTMPPPPDGGWSDDDELLGATVGERRALTRRELHRRLATIGV